MDDLVTWLRARLDGDAEDYRDSRALVPGDLHWAMPSHLDRNFLLADIEAKRRILDEVVPLIDQMDAQIESEWGSGLGPTGESDRLVKLLALPYDARPGYREEWRPE